MGPGRRGDAQVLPHDLRVEQHAGRVLRQRDLDEERVDRRPPTFVETAGALPLRGGRRPGAHEGRPVRARDVEPDNREAVFRGSAAYAAGSGAGGRTCVMAPEEGSSGRALRVGALGPYGLGGPRILP